MKKKLYALLSFSFMGLSSNVYAISGTFYDSISNDTDTPFFSGMQYEYGTDKWDNCGWSWGSGNWTYYRNGNDCSTNTGSFKYLASRTTVGQTGGHSSTVGRTSAHQTFFINNGSADGSNQKFIMWNDVNGSGDEHLYIRMWCQGSEKVYFETAGSNTFFTKTIFTNSPTAGKVDLSYIIMDYDTSNTISPTVTIDLFENKANGLSNIRKIGYISNCFTK